MAEALDRIVWIVIGAVLGGSGVLGLMTHYLKRYIDSKLDTEKAISEKCLSFKTRRAKLTKDMQHAQGRVFFQMYSVIEANHPVTDNLRVAFKNLQTVEDDLEDLNQEIVLDFEQKQK